MKNSRKIIRDVVHGDILFEQKFIDLIDCKEFQRLRRIRQLSTAYLLFPSAEHTRFSHSIGTYHVMKLLIEHFKKIFDDLGMEISKEDEEKALVVALLHDVGHGPFSHAFETALPKEKYKKTHEQWTGEIITSKKSDINKVLIDNFGTEFPEDVASLIEKNSMAKHEHKIDGQLDLFFILSSLISSQLDADRMDYLLRDAFFTGVTHGVYDIKRLIESLTITVCHDQYAVCVQEKYLPVIEEYLLARYQMHESIYFHPFKVEMEIVVRKIISRMFALFEQNKLKMDIIPKALLSVFTGEEIEIDDYLALDDSCLISLFDKLKKEDDSIIKELCNMFLYRKKCKRICVLDEKKEDIDNFLGELKELLESYKYEVKSFDDEYFLLIANPSEPNNEIYKNNKKNIFIVSNGICKDVLLVSKVLKDLKSTKSALYINYNILESEFNGDFEKLKKEIENLITRYNNRNHIEIEKKYCLFNKNTFSEVYDALEKWDNGYKWDSKYNEENGKLQIDTYYDLEGNVLLKNDYTLRVREKNNEKNGKNYIMTVKAPVVKSAVMSDDQGEQNERFEHELSIKSKDIKQCKEYVQRNIPKDIVGKIDDLKPVLIVKNNRVKLNYKKEDIDFEVAFDDVTYVNLDKSKKEMREYQIEIEIKSDYIHRVNLKTITDYLESVVIELEPISDSKYKRGIKFTKK